MSDPFGRENENIESFQVIELSCELAHEDLVFYWKEYMDEPMEITSETGEISYTEKAQDKFNNYYDEVEAELVELMKKNPNFDISKLEKRIREIRYDC